MRLRRPPALDVALRLGPEGAAGVPRQLIEALEDEGIRLRPAAEGDEDGVVVAVGWDAAGPGVCAVLATGAPPPDGAAPALPVLGPPWLGGTLPPGTDVEYAPMPVHRREDLVLVHGETDLAIEAAEMLHERRPALAFAASGVREDLELPFPFLGVDRAPRAVAHAFASATVALAPPVRGWRPAALAMLACGQAVVAPDDAAARSALGDAAAFATDPRGAADAAEAVIDDLALRAERVRAGFARVGAPGWAATGAALAAALRDLAP